MKAGAFFAIALLLGFTSVCSAAEKGRDSQSKYALPSAQLGDYSLKLDTDQPRSLDVPDSGALTALKRDDTMKPFVGFSLSRPITDDFWKIGR
jgi:hypothetical protein